jgi:hypothetical protein
MTPCHVAPSFFAIRGPNTLLLPFGVVRRTLDYGFFQVVEPLIYQLHLRCDTLLQQPKRSPRSPKELQSHATRTWAPETSRPRQRLCATPASTMTAKAATEPFQNAVKAASSLRSWPAKNAMPTASPLSTIHRPPSTERRPKMRTQRRLSDHPDVGFANRFAPRGSWRSCCWGAGRWTRTGSRSASTTTAAMSGRAPARLRSSRGRERCGDRQELVARGVARRAEIWPEAARLDTRMPERRSSVLRLSDNRVWE